LGSIDERNLSPAQFRFIPGYLHGEVLFPLWWWYRDWAQERVQERVAGTEAKAGVLVKQVVLEVHCPPNRTYVGSKETGMSHLKVGRFGHW
jgi:hypothetical protein